MFNTNMLGVFRKIASVFLFSLVWLVPCFATAQSPETVVLSEDQHVVSSDFGHENINLVIDGATITMEGEFRLRNLTLQGNATITQPNQMSLSLMVEDKIDIALGSSIDVSSRGATSGSGNSREGGSHGGAGGGRESKTTYGSFAQPRTFGSATHSYARGGGALKVVANTLVVDGSLRSNGGDSTRYGGASGGSIWLEVGELSGGGSISADGGSAGSSYYDGHGGGGGRVALYYESNGGFDFDRVSLVGGKASSSSDIDGGAGSLYIRNVSEGSGVLRFSGSNEEEAETFSQGTFASNTTIEVINAKVVFDSQQLRTSEEGTPLSGLGIRVDGGYLSFTPVPRGELPIEWNEILIANGGIISHEKINEGDVESNIGINWKVGALTIGAESAIDVSARGESDGFGSSADGASHGGAGGGQAPDTTYGNYSLPDTFGSATHSYARGGGALKIVANTLVVDGSLRSNGGDSTRYGGASGGSIWLEVGELSGGGSISANGGSAGSSYHDGSGGGGGRVALYYESNGGFDFDRVSLVGGRASSSSDIDGGAGSLYFRDVSEENGVLRFSGSNEGEAETFSQGTFASNTTIEVINAKVVFDSQQLLTSEGKTPLRDLGAKVDGGYLSFTPVLREALPVEWDSISVESGGVISHEPVELDEVDSLTGINWRVSSLTIDADSSIDVTNRGSSNGSGSSYDGGSHGGAGGGREADTTYGSFAQPSTFGSATHSYARGGGVLKIVAGTLVVGGSIQSNGGLSTRYGGASGGSIWLEVGELSGGGSISANGGSAGSSYHEGSGGGGGRVALVYGINNEFDLTSVNASGGLASSSGRYDGEDGTVDIQQQAPIAYIYDTNLSEYHDAEISSFVVDFSVAMDAETFGIEDVFVEDEVGNVYGPESVASMSDSRFTIAFGSPLGDGQYRLSIGSDIYAQTGELMDQNQNGVGGEVDDRYEFDFVVDTESPQSVSVNAELAPDINASDSAHYMLSGNRDDNTAIWINGEQRLDYGSGDWSVELSLSEGVNELHVWSVDLAGNQSEPITVLVQVDTIAPNVDSYSPSSWISAIPESIQLELKESGSGLDIEQSGLSVTRNGNSVAGHVVIEDHSMRFTPSIPFVEGEYGYEVVLVDQYGNQRTRSYSFTLDYTPPASPVVADYPSMTAINAHTFTGSKEAETWVYVDGTRASGSYNSTTWSYQKSLDFGDNQIQIETRDRAGNASDPVVANIHYNDQAPGPVAVQVSAEGSGTELHLSWQGYDEYENGNDIALYRLYVATASYSSTEQASVYAEVPGGTQATVVSGLERDTEYYVSVVAVNTQDLYEEQVAPVAAVPIDVEPPEEIGNLQVVSGAEQLNLSWTASPDTMGDLALYRVTYTLGDEVRSLDLSPDSVVSNGTAQYLLTGLLAASSHNIRVSAVDHHDNVSAGLQNSGVTWLNNPEGLQADALGGRAQLNWSPSQPGELVDQYAVYVQPTPFTSVSGLQPEVTVAGGTSEAAVAGLTDGETVYMAVTAINLSGGEDPSVQAVEVTSEADESGPEITQAVYMANGQSANFVNAPILSESGAIHVAASDESRVSYLHIHIDDELVANLPAQSSGNYQHAVDLLALDDGEHQLKVSAYDTLDNLTEETYSFSVELAAPESPGITEPANNFTTNRETLSIEGTSSPETQVQLLNNGDVVAEGLMAGRGGRFSTVLSLEEGENQITAQARYPARGGWSEASNSRLVTLNTQVPDAPGGLSAQPKPQGEVFLDWNQVVSSSESNKVVGYHVYRSSAEIPSLSAPNVQQVTDSLITQTHYTDLVLGDGDYFYAVTAVNEAENESQPSHSVSATVDSEGPRALEVVYTSPAAYDPSTDRFGQGSVSLEVVFDEPLRNKPYFAIVPEGGTPISVDLAESGSSDTRYLGSVDITGSTPSGTAYVVMSAHDDVGNRGTEVVEGGSLVIDAQGPELVELLLSPSDPLKVDEVEGLDVALSIKLNEPLKGGTSPVLIPLLNQEPIAGYEEGIPLVVDQLPDGALPRWLGELALPPTAGQDSSGQPTVDQLTFAYQGVDELDNESSRIRGARSFQVYQGDLPPLDVPANLAAVPRPQGQVELSWEPVDKASAYILYRQGPDDETLVELERTESPTYRDSTEVDGPYEYAVASLRRDNGQESTSAQSETVQVDTRSVAPMAPGGLELELNGAGIVARWDVPGADAQGQPLSTDGLTYNLYRLALGEGEQVGSTEGLEPLQTDIPELIALDAEPSQAEHSYFVTALDAAGNESVPSDTVYLNFGLLPVGHLSVAMAEGQSPVLSWKHQGTSISHYRVYRALGADAEPALLTEEAIPHTASITEFVDSNYDDTMRRGQHVTYSVVAVDEFDAESVEHDIVLPAATVTLDQEETLNRGVMNRVNYRVENRGETAIEGLTLRVDVKHGQDETSHQSERFSVEAGSFSVIPVVIGGYEDLDGLAEMTLRLEQSPQANDQVAISREVSMPVGEAVLSFSLGTETFTRGAIGTATFELENTSEVEAEIVVAEDNGKKPSEQVRLVLEDLDGNVLSTTSIEQYTGDVLTLPNGQTVARVAPGETFTSNSVEIEVPSSAPDEVVLKLVVDKIHYHSGKPTHVSIEGAGTRTRLTLAETDYFAELTDIAPDTVYGPGQTVVLKGRAISREDQAPKSNVPVKLVFDASGFERNATVYTDGEGRFQYDYLSDGNAGTYQVSALHPETRERPNHGQFQVVGADVSPKVLDVRIPRNYAQEIPIRVSAGRDSSLTNVRLVPISPDGLSLPQLPQGVTIDYDGLEQIEPESSAVVTLQFTGDNSASRTGRVKYRVEADHFTGENALGEVLIEYTLSEAVPVLTADPGYIETGLGLEDQVSETLVLTNSGLDVLTGAQVNLLTPEGDSVPEWIRLLTNQNLGDVEIGDHRSVQLNVDPNGMPSEGNYEFALQVTGDNLQTQSFPVFVNLTQSGTGNAFFHLSDIYTATLDENDQLIPGLEGAKVELQNEQVLSETYSLTTDAYGEATFEGIPAGRYSYRATAFDHDSKQGRIWIKPGITASENVFLTNTVINVEWSVREIAIEDRYEIKLEATYETNVPVAVVVFEPQGIQIPVMQKGDVFQGELTLMNHGLIRAFDVEHDLPRSNDMASIEFFREIPNTLEAGQVLTIPYKIRALKDFNPEADAQATGGGCGSFNAMTRVNYKSECANGEQVNDSTAASWNSNWGNCSDGSSVRKEIETVFSDRQPRNVGGFPTYNGGMGGGLPPLWCRADSECEDGNCDNGSGQ